jgi:hypothetical protein
VTVSTTQELDSLLSELAATQPELAEQIRTVFLSSTLELEDARAFISHLAAPRPLPLGGADAAVGRLVDLYPSSEEHGLRLHAALSPESRQHELLARTAARQAARRRPMALGWPPLPQSESLVRSQVLAATHNLFLEAAPEPSEDTVPKKPRKMPRSMGMGKGAPPDLAERHDFYLYGDDELHGLDEDQDGTER